MGFREAASDTHKCSIRSHNISGGLFAPKYLALTVFGEFRSFSRKIYSKSVSSEKYLIQRFEKCNAPPIDPFNCKNIDYLKQTT